MLIPGYKKYKEFVPSKGYDTAEETFIKFGKEIKIHDFVQAGRDGTEISELIKTAGGLQQLKGAMEKIPSAEFVIDLNMDVITANRMLKAAQTAKVELERQAAIKAEMERLEQERIAAEKAAKDNKGE